MKTLKRKLTSRKGESIAETLIALLIAALAMVMLASMITAAVHAVERSRIRMEAYYEAESDMENRSGTPVELTLTLEDEGGNAVTLVPRFSSVGAPVAGTTYTVQGYKNDTFEKTPVIHYVEKDS